MTTATIERRVRIIQDSDAFNPRTEYDSHAGRMLCWHHGYNLGDEHRYESEDCLRELAFEAEDGLWEYIERLEGEVYERLHRRAADHGCNDWKSREAYAYKFIRKRIDDRIEAALSAGYVILPLYLYDHSGITMNTGGFSCGWDSSQVGWIVCDKETINKEFDGDRDKAEKCLESEVEVYDAYISGNVWGYIAEEREVAEDAVEADWEEVDSCWGFYGNDIETIGMKCNLSEEFHEALADADYSYA